MDPKLAQESGSVNTEEEAATYSKEDEFLSHLSQEEKECLGFLIETIDALEVDLEDDDKEGDGIIGDGFYEFLGMVCSTRPTKEKARPNESRPCDIVGVVGNVEPVASSPVAEMVNVRGLASIPGLGPTPKQKATTKGDKKQVKKLKYHGSEDAMGLESGAPGQSWVSEPDEQGSPRSLTLLPAHAKKFDTILRSGVSVHELRAQVLARLSGSAQKQPSSQLEGLAAHSDSLRLLGSPEQRAARQDALQRLGLWKLTGDASRGNDAVSTQPLATEKAQKSTSPPSAAEKDREAALKKLGLLNL